MAWLNDWTGRWSLKTSGFFYNLLGLLSGWLIGQIIRQSLVTIRLNYIAASAVRALPSQLSPAERFLLSDGYTGAIQLVVALMMILGLVWSNYLFGRHKIDGPLQQMKQIDSVELPNGNQDELSRLVSHFMDHRQRLMQEQFQANQLTRNLEQQIAGLLHELKNPLTTLKGDIELLSINPSAELINQVLPRMERSQKRMEDYLRRLHQRQTIGQITAQLTRYNWNDTWEKWQAGEPDNELVVFHRLLNETAVYVCLDETLFFEAIDNIIHNAKRFAKQRIDIICQIEPKQLRLIIRDDGPGFSEQALQRGLECFYSDNPGVGNMGYGLYLAEQLLAKQDIQLSLANQSGAEVRLLIPLVKA